MDPATVDRAIAAATTTARALGLEVDDVVVLHRSNKLALRLTPCDVMARVAPTGLEVAALEVELARQLAELGAPVARLEPRVDPDVHVRDGFTTTLWTSYPPAEPLPPAAFAEALARLHQGMRRVDVPVGRFTERIDAAEEIVADPSRSPDLSDEDRRFLGDRVATLREAVLRRGAAEQLLHGEPHPGNLLSTASGPRFIDLETCCTGPVAFDLAHVPAAVSDHYPGLDQELLSECRQLVLAMVAAWRWDADDRFPEGPRFGTALLRALRAGPPWPTLDQVLPSPPPSS